MLDTKIEFITSNNSIDDEGYPHSSPESKCTFHAEIKNFNNEEFMAAYTTKSKTVISFKVRYCKFTKDLCFDTKTYQIKYNNDYYNIINANDLNQKHKYIIVKAEKVD